MDALSLTDDAITRSPLWLVLYRQRQPAEWAGAFVGNTDTRPARCWPVCCLACAGAFVLSACNVAHRGAGRGRLCALGISLGGSETYGQTVGIDSRRRIDRQLGGTSLGTFWPLRSKEGFGLPLPAQCWGWGWATARIGPLELAVLLIVMLAGHVLGPLSLEHALRSGNRAAAASLFLGRLVLGARRELEPRREQWGGLLGALVVLVAYVGVVRKDRLAVRLAGWGFLGGALGFPGGQCLQAYHAWNVDSFRQGWFATLEPHMNWWNFMETTFGAVFATVLALGLWLNRDLIAAEETEATHVLSQPVEWLLVAVHVTTLDRLEFRRVSSSGFGCRPCAPDDRDSARGRDGRPTLAVSAYAANRRLAHRRQDAAAILLRGDRPYRHSPVMLFTWSFHCS